MPLLETAASRIGHGRMGLRSSLRTLQTLAKESACQKHAFAEVRGAKLLTSGWSVHSGSIYKISVDEMFEGRRLDVVSVRLASSALTRVEAIADMVAGTFYFDPGASAASDLYVWLSDSSNPANTAVLAIFGFYFGSCRAVQPTLGPDKLVDGALTLWTSSTNLTEWTEAGSGVSGGSVNHDTSIVPPGYSDSARIEGTCIPAGYQSFNNDAKNMATVSGARYRFSGYYRTDATNPAQVIAAVGLQGTGSANVYDDGRSTTTAAAQLLPLSSTGGEWRRFIFDVIAPGTTIFCRLYLTTTATGVGKVWFGGLKFQRVYRFEEHQSRFTVESLPSIDVGRRGIFFDREFTGNGSMSLVNGDGALEEVFGTYEFTNAEVTLRLGGRFPEGWNEVLTDGQLVRRWRVRRVVVRPEAARLELDDPMQVLSTLLPVNAYDPADSAAFADLADLDAGRPRPWVFGTTDTNVRPARIDVGANGYGIYSLLDETFGDASTSGTVTSEAWSYTDEEAAKRQDADRRLQLRQTGAGGPSAVWGISKLTINKDCQIIEIIAGVNDKLDFDEGAGALVATIAPGLYFPADPKEGGGSDLDAAVKTALDAAGATYTVSYSESTHKYTITKDAGNWTPHLDNAATNRDQTAWRLLGFSASTNPAAANAQVGDTAIFEDPDRQHILRIKMSGYRDDTSGTYTGSSKGIIQKAGDVMYYMLAACLDVPAAEVDLASVTAVRTGADNLRIYLGAEGDEYHELGQVIEWIGNSNGIDIVHDGDRWIMERRSNTVPSDILDLGDRDLLDFEAWQEEDDFASAIRIEGIQDPSTGRLQSATVTEDHFNPALAALCAAAKARLGRTKTKVFRTYLSGGVTWLDSLILNATTPRRRCRFSVKGTCLTLRPGSKVRITTTMIGTSPAVFRILSKRDSWSTWVSEVEAAEVLSLTDGW